MQIEVSFPGGRRVDASVGQHIVRTDQPVMGGGEDSAPTPFALFLSSLATCAGIYVLGFCQQRNIPTDDIRLIQSLEFDPQTRMVSNVNIDIQLPADFPPQYQSAVIRSAEMCAVKKHMENPPSFDIKTHIAGQ